MLEKGSILLESLLLLYSISLQFLAKIIHILGAKTNLKRVHVGGKLTLPIKHVIGVRHTSFIRNYYKSIFKVIVGIYRLINYYELNNNALARN